MHLGKRRILIRMSLKSEQNINQKWKSENLSYTRMHSSRMRAVCCSGHLGGADVCLWSWGDVCLWSGGVHPPGRHPPGQTSPRPVHAAIHIPPADRIPDACENITFLQRLLRTVNMQLCSLLRFPKLKAINFKTDFGGETKTITN